MITFTGNIWLHVFEGFNNFAVWPSNIQVVNKKKSKFLLIIKLRHQAGTALFLNCPSLLKLQTAKE